MKKTSGYLAASMLAMMACGDSSTDNGNDTPQCGNGIIESGEICDSTALNGQSCDSLGHEAGELACDDACQFDHTGCSDEVCGNGVIDADEACDTTDLGGVTCGDEGFGGGELACSGDCTLDTSGCILNQGCQALEEGLARCDCVPTPCTGTTVEICTYFGSGVYEWAADADCSANGQECFYPNAGVALCRDPLMGALEGERCDDLPDAVSPTTTCEAGVVCYPLDTDEGICLRPCASDLDCDTANNQFCEMDQRLFSDANGDPLDVCWWIGASDDACLYGSTAGCGAGLECAPTGQSAGATCGAGCDHADLGTQGSCAAGETCLPDDTDTLLAWDYDPTSPPCTSGSCGAGWTCLPIERDAQGDPILSVCAQRQGRCGTPVDIQTDMAPSRYLTSGGVTSWWETQSCHTVPTSSTSLSGLELCALPADGNASVECVQVGSWFLPATDSQGFEIPCDLTAFGSVECMIHYGVDCLDAAGTGLCGMMIKTCVAFCEEEGVGGVGGNPAAELTCPTGLECGAPWPVDPASWDPLVFEFDGVILETTVSDPYVLCPNGDLDCDSTAGFSCIPIQTFGDFCARPRKVCRTPFTCPNGAIDSGEDCDGSLLGGLTCADLGFTAGALACSPTCQYDPSGCNGLVSCDGGTIDHMLEECDGTDFGGQTCISLGFPGGGNLSCTSECAFDTSSCTP